MNKNQTTGYVPVLHSEKESTLSAFLNFLLNVCEEISSVKQHGILIMHREGNRREISFKTKQGKFSLIMQEGGNDESSN
jgi:hypothetical protein